MSKSVFPTYSIFLRRYTPQLMASITFPGILEMILPNEAPKVLVLFLTGALVYFFLKEEGKIYLIAEIKNQFSTINLEHASDENLSKDWQLYTFLTALYLMAILGFITYNVRL